MAQEKIVNRQRPGPSAPKMVHGNASEAYSEPDAGYAEGIINKQP